MNSNDILALLELIDEVFPLNGFENFNGHHSINRLDSVLVITLHLPDKSNPSKPFSWQLIFDHKGDIIDKDLLLAVKADYEARTADTLLEIHHKENLNAGV